MHNFQTEVHLDNYLHNDIDRRLYLDNAFVGPLGQLANLIGNDGNWYNLLFIPIRFHSAKC